MSNEVPILPIESSPQVADEEHQKQTGQLLSPTMVSERMSTGECFSPTTTATITSRNGHLINKNIADVEREIFVGDLSYFCSEQDLLALFSPFGKVIGARVRRSESTNQSLMYGFVKMEDAEQARNTVQHLENTLFLGRILR
jgi:RNA recognition motif-containing protein